MGNTGEFVSILNEKFASRVGNLTSNFIKSLNSQSGVSFSRGFDRPIRPTMGYLLTCLIQSPPTAPGGIVGLILRLL